MNIFSFAGICIGLSFGLLTVSLPAAAAVFALSFSLFYINGVFDA